MASHRRRPYGVLGLQALFDVDLECLSCLGPLTEANLLVPCGHTICHDCADEMEQASQLSLLGAGKFCPVCRQASVAAGEDGFDGFDERPVEAYRNHMLDVVLARSRAKALDARALLPTLDRIITGAEGVADSTAPPAAAPTAAVAAPAPVPI